MGENNECFHLLCSDLGLNFDETNELFCYLSMYTKNISLDNLVFNLDELIKKVKSFEMKLHNTDDNVVKRIIIGYATSYDYKLEYILKYFSVI